MKPAKKSIITAVAATVIASIMMTAVSAEGLYYSASATQLPSGTASAPAPVTAPAQQSSEDDGTWTYQIYSQSGDSTVESVVSDLRTSLISSENLQDYQLDAGLNVVNFSKQFDGYRYVFGASSPKVGFDCSGLVHYVYSHFGYTLPRTARAQYNVGTSVDKANLQPGDLVFFATSGGRTITHVGIYLGDGAFIHAATTHQGVIVSSLTSAYWTQTLVGARRIITPETALKVAYQ